METKTIREPQNQPHLICATCRNVDAWHMTYCPKCGDDALIEVVNTLEVLSYGN